MTLPAYVAAVRSTGILFAGVFGYYFFKESLKGKLVPTLIIVAGIVVITLTQADIH